MIAPHDVALPIAHCASGEYPTGGGFTLTNNFSNSTEYLADIAESHVQGDGWEVLIRNSDVNSITAVVRAS